MDTIEARAYCPECHKADFYHVGFKVHPVAPVEGLTETTKLVCTYCKKPFEADIRVEIHITTRREGKTDDLHKNDRKVKP